MANGKNGSITSRLYRFTKKSIEYELIRPLRTHPQVPTSLPTPLTIHAIDPNQKFRQRSCLPMLTTCSRRRGRIVLRATHESKQVELSFNNQEKERWLYLQENKMSKDVLRMFFLRKNVHIRMSLPRLLKLSIKS